jgi:hypothetical protein
MEIRTSHYAPQRSDALSLTMVLACLILPTALLAVVMLQPWAEPKWMFLDPLAAAEYAPKCCSVYYGFVSNAGMLLWTLTAAICLFSVMLLLGREDTKPLRRFALSAGLLTGWIALDDMFLLHERVFPNLGVPQMLVISLYLALGLLYGLANWRFIWSQDWWLLAIGGAGLALSIFVDAVFHSLNPARVYIEDSAKFFGIFAWSTFHCFTLYLHLRER